MKYQRTFDNTNSNWNEGQFEFNLIFLRQFENHFNQMLRIQGHVFLNDVYVGLGMRKSREGQRMGWRLDPHHPNHPNQVRLSLVADRDTQSIQVEFLGATDILDVLESEEVMVS